MQNRFPLRRHRPAGISRRRFSRGGARRLGVFEPLEPRLALSAAGPIGDTPYIDLGTSDNVAWDQPRVAVELLTDAAGSGSVGPAFFNTWLLDTGANSVMAFANAVADMKQPPHVYQTEGTFAELGVGGVHLFDISASYRFDFAGDTGIRNTLLDTRILSDEENELSILGPRGIVGMPAMADRVTTFDYTVWTNFNLDTLFMKVDFSDTLPADNGHRLSVTVDNRVSFSPEGQVITGDHPPVWADIPFMTGHLKHNDLVASGNLLLDSGAQVSVLSSSLAQQLGLDSNHDGVLDENDANFARYETVGGVGGTRTVPVFLVDEVHIPTQQGPDLVWTELQWLVLDIIEGIDGVFGFDNMTSGWIEASAVDGQSGYIMKNYLDFRDWSSTGTGTVHFDLNPEVHQVIDPLGPGARVTERGRWTTVSETGIDDTYQIVLTQPPTHDVTIQLTNIDGQITAVDAADSSRDYLVFTPSNWDTPQTVRVSAVDDSKMENFHRSSIKHVSSSEDPDYQGVGMPRIIVNIIDDDFAGVMLIPTDGATEVREGGPPDTYDVVLTKAPADDVSIFLENASGQVTASGPGGDPSLVFTPANWDVPQTVTVRAVDDQLLEGDHNAYITHRISGTGEYSEAFPLQEYVTIAENDTADFGDAPAPYPTTVGRDGARHVGNGLVLGNNVDYEVDGQPHPEAAGDDMAGTVDDEDGVTLPANLQPGQSTTVTVRASAAGLLNAWVDFNDDGDWEDPGEQIFADAAIGTGISELSFSVPAAATVTDQTFARFRLSTQGGLSFTGLAPDGEVEDYAVALGDADAADPPRVEGVYLRGQDWNSSFLDHLDAQNYGHSGIARLGFGPTVGNGDQLAPLPWNTVDQVTIVFDQDVQVAADDLSVIGVNQASYGTADFAYDATSHSATWTFKNALPLDKVLLVLQSDAASGVAGSGGLALDGEWDNPSDRDDTTADVYPSGDGTAGGNFHFRFNVLPGDTNQSGGASIDDIGPLRDGLGSLVGNSNYNYLADANGSGGISVDDIPALRDHLGRLLPEGEPQADGSGSGDGGAAMVVIGGFEAGRLAALARLSSEVCFPLVKLAGDSGQWRYYEQAPQFSLAAASARAGHPRSMLTGLLDPIAAADMGGARPEQLPSLIQPDVITTPVAITTPFASSSSTQAQLVHLRSAAPPDDASRSESLPEVETTDSTLEQVILDGELQEENAQPSVDSASLIDESLLDDLVQDRI